MFEKDSMVWSQSVFGNAQLGDKRRTKRLVKVAGMIADHPDCSLDGAFGDDRAGAEGAQRLVRNSEISSEEVFEAGAKSTALTASQHEGLILALEDTTTLGYSHSARAELGDLGGHENSRNRGYFVHSVLLVDASQGGVIGLIEQSRWCRNYKRGRRHLRKQLPYEKKESYKWSRASEGIRKRLDSDTLSRVISVCDRESDVWEYMLDKISHNERFVIRSSWNRSVVEDEAKLLRDAMDSAPVLGNQTVEVMARGGRPSRTAKVTVRAKVVEIRVPSRMGKRGKDTMKVGAVLVREDNPSPDVDALEWLLLTSEAVCDFDDAVFVLGCYQRRWTIEEWHKVWKTGCGVEKNRQQKASRLELMAVITSFVASRLLQLKNLALYKPDSKCTSILQAEEWQCLWLSIEKNKNIPKIVPSVDWAFHALGRLGGWHDTQRTGRIGWISLWRGWTKLQERIEGLKIALSIKADICD